MSVSLFTRTGKKYKIPAWLFNGLVLLLLCGCVAGVLLAGHYYCLWQDTQHTLEMQQHSKDFLADRVRYYKGLLGQVTKYGALTLLPRDELVQITQAASMNEELYIHTLWVVENQLEQLYQLYNALKLSTGFKEDLFPDIMIPATGGPGYDGVLLWRMEQLQNSMMHYFTLITQQASTQNELPFGTPLQGRITSYFGEPRDHGPHKGIDIGAPIGSPVAVSADGVIYKAAYVKSYGLTVWVSHTGGYQTRYAHLGTLNVKEGDKVNVGDIIGTIGMTGKTTGPHLHYEVRLNGVPMNPIYYLVLLAH